MKPFFDDLVAAWVADRIPGCERGFGACRAMGVESRGQMAAGVVFHNWSPAHGVVEMSCAAENPKWFTRRVANVAMLYAFDGLRCQMVTARYSEGNAPARRIWQALGCDEHIIPRLRGRDAAEVIATLTAEQWQASKFYRR